MSAKGTHWQRIDWYKARTKYVTDTSLSYDDIAKLFNVSMGQVAARALKEKWVALREETIKKSIQNLPQTAGDFINEANTRHINIAKALQSKGLTKMKDTEPEDFKTAVDTTIKGVELERKVYNIYQEQQLPVNIQINFTNDNLKDKNLTENINDWSK